MHSFHLLGGCVHPFLHSEHTWLIRLWRLNDRVKSIDFIPLRVNSISCESFDFKSLDFLSVIFIIRGDSGVFRSWPSKTRIFGALEDCIPVFFLLAQIISLSNKDFHGHNFNKVIHCFCIQGRRIRACVGYIRYFSNQHKT